MVIRSRCAGKISVIGNSTYMVIFQQWRALVRILLEACMLCAVALLKSRSSDSTVRHALYPFHLNLSISYNKIFPHVCKMFMDD